MWLDFTRWISLLYVYRYQTQICLFAPLEEFIFRQSKKPTCTPGGILTFSGGGVVLSEVSDVSKTFWLRSVPNLHVWFYHRTYLLFNFEDLSPTQVCSGVLISSEVDWVVLVDGLWQISSLTRSVQQLPGRQLISPLVYPRTDGWETQKKRLWERERGCSRQTNGLLALEPKSKNDQAVYSHTVGLRQTTRGSVFGQEAILQVDHRLADLLVFAQHVVVIQHHPKVLVQREGAGELEHPERKRQRRMWTLILQWCPKRSSHNICCLTVCDKPTETSPAASWTTVLKPWIDTILVCWNHEWPHLDGGVELPLLCLHPDWTESPRKCHGSQN